MLHFHMRTSALATMLLAAGLLVAAPTLTTPAFAAPKAAEKVTSPKTTKAAGSCCNRPELAKVNPAAKAKAKVQKQQAQ
jgi:hypothetical protein